MPSSVSLSRAPLNKISAKKYRHNLNAYMALCEQNYARLKKLMPDMQTTQGRLFGVGENGTNERRVSLLVTEQCRYTTMLELKDLSSTESWLPKPCMSIRVYHDAQMAEVISFQRHHRIKPAYEYPNKNMFYADEKAQVLKLLSEWLSFCLEQGRALEEMNF